jgi:hypothetical protein
MSDGTAAALAPAAPLTWRSAFDAWRGITSGQAWLALAFGVFCFLYDQLPLLKMMLATPGFRGRPFLLTLTFLGDVLAACALMGCIVVAERTHGARTRQTIYLAAIVASAAIAGLLKLFPRSGALMFGSEPNPGYILLDAVWAGFFQWLIIGGAATFVYVDSRRARAARERLHVAELDRARAARRTLESRLQAMQARVEPRFLFNTLSQVEGLYRVSAARGERMIDQLIAYLHAAMPKMRDTSSTLAQELELVRAYLGILQVKHGETFDFTVEAPPPAIADARVPPMMLLPLVEHALSAPSPPGPSAARSIVLRPGVADSGLLLEITDTGRGFAPERESDIVVGVRERLHALHGPNGRLELAAVPGGSTVAVLALPLGAS